VSSDPDVIVVGGGNAALCAALAASEQGARVTLLERAPEGDRGGNSYLTAGAFRFPYRGLEELARIVDDPIVDERATLEIEPYTDEAFRTDLERVTRGRTDADLAAALVSEAYPAMLWLRERGTPFTLSYDRQSYLVGGRHRFWGGIVVKVKGEGPALVGALYRACEAAGVRVEYRARATALRWDSDTRRWRVSVAAAGTAHGYSAPAVVLACGGFEANPQMRAAYLGPSWDLVKVRGGPYNTGDGIRMGLEAGAHPHGHWSGCHAVAWDSGAPDYNVHRLVQHYERDSYPLGLYVNLRGERFVDEGLDFRNYTYAQYGREIAKQPNQLAFQIFDQKVLALLRHPYALPGTTRIEASALSELARNAGIDPHGLERTIASYNAAVSDQPFNPAEKDGKAAVGVTPGKSNWAQRLDAPPYVCFPVTCGITFTFGGLRISPAAQVLDSDAHALPGLFACGELAAGLFYHGYPGGSGLMAGTVFGRRAGTGAAEAARRDASSRDA